MPNQILRDEQGHVLGMMETTPGGIVDARDPNGDISVAMTSKVTSHVIQKVTLLVRATCLHP